MKKILSIFTAILISASISTVSAVDFTIDGIKYTLISLFDRTVKITEVQPNVKEFVIPDSVSYQGRYFSVIEIRDSILIGNKNLTKVVVGESVQKIGMCAFENCTNLSDVTLKGDKLTISEYAFSGCSSLKDLILGEGVATIKQYAFKDIGIKNVIFPSTILIIEEDAFEGCEILDVEVKGAPDFDESDKVYFYVRGNFNKVQRLHFDKPLYNPLSGKNYLSLLPENTKISYGDNVHMIYEGIFSYNKSITELYIPHFIQFLDGNSFLGCSNLKKIVIESGDQRLKIIGRYVMGPKSVIGTDYPFMGDFDEFCVGDRYIYMPEPRMEYPYSIYPAKITIDKYRFNDGVKNTGKSGQILSYVKNLILCESIETVSGPFGSCLESISGCLDNVKKVEASFKGYDWITDMPFKNAIELGANAFINCKGLVTLSKMDSLRIIKDNVFKGCVNLKNIPEARLLETIGKEAFSGCKSLGEVHLYDKVSTVGEGAFLACENIDNVYCYSEEPPTCTGDDTQLFPESVFLEATLYVPEASLKKYIESKGWGNFWNIKGFDPSGIKTAEVDGTDITVVDGMIVGNYAGSVKIYDINGKYVYEGEIGEGIRLSKGVYIVKYGSKAIKLTV